LNPPGYYLALNAWGAVAGWTPYAGRALSLFVGLPSDAHACRAANLSLVGLPTGDYTLMAVVYNWSTGERLLALDVVTGDSGERLLVGTFEVIA
jgi:hypothetical protein